MSHFKKREYLFRWPSPKAMSSIRSCVRELTDRRRWAGLQDIHDVVNVLNPRLRGWGNYFRTGNASWKFQQVDRYVSQQLVRLLPHVRGWRRRPFNLRQWPPARFVEEFGLHRLVGTIRYPGLVNAS
jgi:RNA-directed DNA polymerase